MKYRLACNHLVVDPRKPCPRCAQWTPAARAAVGLRTTSKALARLGKPDRSAQNAPAATA